MSEKKYKALSSIRKYQAGIIHNSRSNIIHQFRTMKNDESKFYGLLLIIQHIMYVHYYNILN